MLEQEIASIIKYVLNKAGSPSPYYDEVPEGFLVPAVYFPTPEISSKGDTLSTYALSYVWFIKLFHKDTPSAHMLGVNVLTALQSGHCRIPLITNDGTETARAFRLKDPSMKAIDGANGVVQLTLTWDSPRPYVSPEAQKMMVYDLDMYTRGAFDEAVRGLSDST